MTRQEAFDKIRNIIVDQFDIAPDEVTEAMDLQKDLDADSISMMEFVLAIESEFDIEVSDEDAEKIHTIGEALDYLAQ